MAADRVGRRTVLRAGALAAAGPVVAACGAVDNLLAASSVRVAVTWGDAELAAFQSVLDGFRRRYQYDVDVIPLGDAIADAVSAQVNGRPDVVMLPRPGLITENLARIAPLPDGVWHDDWLPRAWRDVVWHRGPGGALVPYGLPFKVTNESALWYRADLFDALHLSPPTTWSDWLVLNDTLIRRGIAPLAIGGGDGWPLTTFFANVLRSCYPDTYWQLAQPQPPIDVWGSKEVNQALRLMGGMLSVNGVLSGGVARTLANQFPDSVVEVFGYHNAAMVVSADFAAPVIDEFLQPPARIGVVTFPVVDGINRDRTGSGDQDLVAGTARFANSRPLVISADIAVLLHPVSAGAAALVGWLAEPDAPLPWITDHGGFIAANQQTPSTFYQPDVLPLTEQVSGSEFVFDLSDLLGSLGGSGALFQVLEEFLRTVGDGGTDRVDDAAAVVAGRMRDIEAAHGR
ncbi:MAG TPA: ABC transporter substrate-binding protein [Pseudonocardiaceae bacterium]|nr:ABC transporter substrate-binding protein [Pseudonocardiaceae bacterium]